MVDLSKKKEKIVNQYKEICFQAETVKKETIKELKEFLSVEQEVGSKEHVSRYKMSSGRLSRAFGLKSGDRSIMVPPKKIGEMVDKIIFATEVDAHYGVKINQMSLSENTKQLEIKKKAQISSSFMEVSISDDTLPRIVEIDNKLSKYWDACQKIKKIEKIADKFNIDTAKIKKENNFTVNNSRRFVFNDAYTNKPNSYVDFPLRPEDEIKLKSVSKTKKKLLVKDILAKRTGR